MDFSNPFQGTTMNQIFTVQGMTCGHCEKAVTTAIKLLDPQAQVTHRPRQQPRRSEHHTAARTVAEAIREEGYQVAA